MTIHQMQSRLLFLALLLSVSSITAETMISGSLHQISFIEAGNPYIVYQDIVIPENVEVKIGAGCVILFKAFTGMRVEGKLIVEGTADKPVVFTSIYDSKYNSNSTQAANAFDWNGIVIASGSRAIMKNFVLQYSVFGMKVDQPDITIRLGTFYQNGQSNLTIGEKLQMVIEGSPFTYVPPGAKMIDEEAQNDAVVSASVAPAPKKPVSVKKVFRYTSLVVGLAGAGVGVVTSLQAAKSAKAFKDFPNQRMAYTQANGSAAYSAELNKRDTAQKKDKATAILFDVLGLVGLAGFTVTFVF